ncbi:MAG: DUF421 domain-containing protein [Clostridia bacterium]|nr:DUF421 domain-containing protein [Clostridia bacterium]
MLTIFTRSVLLYIASLLAMRAMGKREVGQLQPFELVVVIMIAELAATPMGGVGIPLLYGILPMVALVVCHGLITALCMKWQPFRAWMSGQPTVLMRNGVICEKQMRKSAMDLNDLMEAIRTAGILDPSEVGTVVLEPGGQVNAFPKADFRSVSPSDMALNVPAEGLPLPLVMDGIIQHDNLTRGKLTETWLREVARSAGYPDLAQVLFLCLNTQGEMLIQGKSSTKTELKSVLKPEKVVW